LEHIEQSEQEPKIKNASSLNEEERRTKTKFLMVKAVEMVGTAQMMPMSRCAYGYRESRLASV
jgi:UDP-N-acetylenolpyruvoylglucosamine reductase